MTTTVTIRVNGDVTRFVRIGDTPPVEVGPNGERTFKDLPEGPVNVEIGAEIKPEEEPANG